MKYLNLLIVIVLNGVFSLNAQSVAPEKGTGSKYFFNNKNVYFEIDTANGARITSFKLNNKEILYTDDAGDMDGSTFWPSPQNPSPPNWGWPPIAAIDYMPYTTKIDNNKLIMKGSLDSKFKLRVYKVFTADEKDTSISITYYLKNENTVAKSYAPWEVTRVPHEGLTFFGKGENSIFGDMAKSAVLSIGCYWYDQNKQASGSKFFCDGLGWIAHVNSNKQVFIKKYENIKASSAANYGKSGAEAEIEVYTANYTEIENQGAYVSIPPGGSIGWRVKWYARDLPVGLVAAVGEQKLLDLANRIINLDTSTPVIDDLSALELVYVNVLGINETDVKLHPNPAKNVITLSGLQEGSQQSIAIYNLQGALMMQQPINENNSALNISYLKSGSYIYTVNNSTSVIKRGVLFVIN